MEIQIQRKSSQIYVTLRGRLDGNTVRDLEQSCQDLEQLEQLEVYFDLMDLSYLSSAGIAFFIKISKGLTAHGGSLAFSGVRGEVRKVFDITGLSLLFNIREEGFQSPSSQERKSLTTASQRERLSLPARLDSLNFFRDFVSNYIRRSNLSSKIMPSADLILEEIVVNIVKHGYCEAQGDVELICSHEEGVLCLEFWDQCPPFNPLEHDVADLSAPLEERKVGGLGIHLVKEMAERVEYAREGASNIFKVWLAAK